MDIKEMQDTLLAVRGDEPVPVAETDRIQLAYWKVQKTKQPTRDPEVLRKLAAIASRFDKTQYTVNSLSNRAAKQAVANCVEFIYAKMFPSNNGRK